MGEYKLLVALCVFGICLTAIVALPFEHPQIIWTPAKPIKIDETDVVHVRKVREVSADELVLPSDRQYEADIYWRPWNHYIPEDAVVGGYRDRGCGKKPIYLAQVYRSGDYTSAIVPTEIFAESGSVKYSYAGAQIESRRDIKILCADDPSLLTWITNKEAKKINITADKDCVVGGSEQEQKFHTFFGRVVVEKKTHIGKLLYQDNVTYIPYFGEEKGMAEYEILCYKKAIEMRKEEAAKREADQNTPEAKKQLDDKYEKLNKGKKSEEKNKNDEDKKSEARTEEVDFNIQPIEDSL